MNPKRRLLKAARGRELCSDADHQGPAGFGRGTGGRAQAQTAGDVEKVQEHWAADVVGSSGVAGAGVAGLLARDREEPEGAASRADVQTGISEWRSELKVKKLKLEQTRARLEVQITRWNEAVEKLQKERRVDSQVVGVGPDEKAADIISGTAYDCDLIE